MDEEQSNKKINVSSFFQRPDGDERIGSNSLSRSNSSFSAINNLQVLIQNISMQVDNMKTEIREIANYILVEKKLAKDTIEDAKLEAQDQKQKDQMTERALGLSTINPDQKDKPIIGEFGTDEKKGGGFLGGLLKAIAIGGIAALALPLIPVIAPLLLKAMAIGIAAIAGGIVIKETLKLATMLGKKIADGLGQAMKFGKEVFDKLSVKVNKLGQDIGGFLSKKTKQALALGIKVKDKVADKIGDVTDFAKEKGKELKENTTKFIDSAKDKAKNVFGFFKDKALPKAKEIGAGVLEKGKEGFDKVNEAMDKGRRTIFKGMVKGVDAITGNVFDLDKSGEGLTGTIGMAVNALEEAKDLTGGVLDAATGDRFDFDGKGKNPSTLVQAQTPQVSEAELLPTDAPMPFIRVLDNSHLSINPGRNNLPPEIAKLIQ